MSFVSKSKVLTLTKRITAFVLLACFVFSFATINVSAANEYYYKGFDITYNRGAGYHAYTKTWNGGFLWLTKYQERYFMTNSYMRCVTYYHGSWIANQDQVLTISSSKSVTRNVSAGVSAELGVEDVVSAQLGASHSASVTTEYSSSLGLSYDLSKFAHNSYRIAAMGYYDKFIVYKYKNGSYQTSYTCYSYDADFGQEIRLVYRY